MRHELVLAPDQDVVLGALDARSCRRSKKLVADRVAEQLPQRVSAHVKIFSFPEPWGWLSAISSPSTRRDRAALDFCASISSSAGSRASLAQLLGVEDRPVGREPDDRREEQQDEHEEAEIGAFIRASPAVRAHAARRASAGRRARSEIISSSASRTMFATTELPP